MNESIFDTIKLMLVSVDDPAYDAFDTEILVDINAAIMRLKDLAFDDTPFIVTGSSETWEDLIEDPQDYAAVKLFLYLKTKLMFDPPANGTILNAYNEQIKELEFTILSGYEKRHPPKFIHEEVSDDE